ncbi:hypothetical protein MB2181_02620 [Methylophilales bacterium HTCC2181]|uniref:Outer-membrane lipoprotein LolB n=1 Tax=Methylophilales bacterium HTCC2181 TaxID=383631 RepID=A0P5X1_9PROT|nr:hypothetical protein MB2181_02620 [Methylophilales bacterium HTCC2181]
MRHLILFIGLLGAAGCASLSSNSETYDILDAKFDRKEEIEGFNFTGKFVTFINDKGFSGSLAWDSNPNNDFVKIYNPFNSLVAVITLKHNEKKVDLQIVGKNSRANTGQMLKKIFIEEKNIFTLKKFLINPPGNLSKEENIDVNFDGWKIRYRGRHNQGPTAETTLFEKNNISIKIFINKWEYLNH